MKISTRISFFSILAAALFISAIPASATVNVSSPYNGETVGSSIWLSANTPDCSNQTPSAMGYSYDNSPDTTIIYGSSINTWIPAYAGNHTLHVKAWGNQGSSCDTDITVYLGSGSSSSSGSGSASGPYIPSNASSNSNIQTLGNWQSEQDSAVGGWASGWTNLVASPSGDGTTVRQLATTYSGYGNYRYDVAFGDDTSAHNFVYDAWVYLTNSTNSTSNIEMDMNQTMPNGQTVIFGFQCDGWSNTWDYTLNAGNPWSPVDEWQHSGAYCNIQNWGQNQWHHVQVSYSRDDSGNVTYQSVWLDGNQQQINATVNSAFALGWGPVLLTNFQVDELYSWGSNATIFLGNLTISRW